MDAVTEVLLPDEAELRRRVGRLSLEQKIRLLTGADFWALYAEPEVGLGAHRPDQAARVLLTVIEKDPDGVARALEKQR